jgi:hypothetical protein
VSTRFPSNLSFLEPELSRDCHEFPVGASLPDIEAAERTVGPIPEDLRAFLLATNGARLFKPRIKFFRICTDPSNDVDELVKANTGLRLPGGWFGPGDLFFADVDWKGLCDWYLIARDKPGQPVVAFSGDPSFVRECAPSFVDWLHLMLGNAGVLPGRASP